jgi:hypothetical protein
MWDWISENWQTWITFLVGSALAVYLYKRGNRKRLPRYAIRNTKLIEGAKSRFPKLTVHYDGFGPVSGQDQLENFSGGLVAFWNAGSETIRKEDIAAKDPIVIKGIDGSTILDASVIQANGVNRFKAILDKRSNAVTITFEYLDRDEGGVIEILHTGLSAQELLIVGTVKGAGAPVMGGSWPVRKPMERQRKRTTGGLSRFQLTRRFYRISLLVMFGACLLPYVLGFLFPTVFGPHAGLSEEEIAIRAARQRSDTGWEVVPIIILLFLVLQSLWFMWFIWTGTGSWVPKSLDKFHADY